MFKTSLYQATHAGIMFWFGGKYVETTCLQYLADVAETGWATVQQNSSHLKPPSRYIRPKVPRPICIDIK